MPTCWHASPKPALPYYLHPHAPCTFTPCRIGDQPLVRVSLHPPLEGSLQPGATLAGTLDFASHAMAAAHGAAADSSSPTPGAGAHGPRCMQVRVRWSGLRQLGQP